MRISKALPLLALATITLAACSDTGSAPAAPETSLRPAGPRMTLATTTVTTAVLYPQYDNVYVSIEGPRMYIPANSICQLGTSGYGPSTWDLPCTPATNPIVFTIKSTVDASGKARIDVMPDVRFSPSKTVLVDFANAQAATSFSALINYCPTGALACIDESKTDASLKTYTNPSTGRVYRRIKHFSGYHVVFGNDCGENSFGCENEGGWDREFGSDASDEPTADRSGSRSGYITTTGRSLGATH